MDYMILDSKTREFKINSILIQIKPFEQLGPGPGLKSSVLQLSVKVYSIACKPTHCNLCI